MSKSEQIDLATLLLRIEQINEEDAPQHFLWQRVISCDLPRLWSLITDEDVLEAVSQVTDPSPPAQTHIAP